MANFQPDLNIEYDGRLLNGTDLLYDTTQGVRIWGNATQDNYSIGDTTTGGVDYTYGTNNLAFGQNALNATGSSKQYNIAIGTNSLKALTGTSNNNIGIGRNAGWQAISLTSNVFIGTEILNSYTTGLLDSSVFIGNKVCRLLTSGGSTNVIIGNKALSYATSVGIGNIVIGDAIGDISLNASGVASIGNNAVYLGAGINIDGTYLAGGSVTIGAYAGVPRTSGTSYDVCIGWNAGFNSTGISQVIIGSDANGGAGSVSIGRLAGASLNATGSNNIIIGFQAATNLTTGSNNIIIGANLSAQSAIGSNNIDILTNAGNAGIQYTHSTGLLSLKSTKANIEGRLSVGSSTSTAIANIAMLGTISGATTAYAVFDNAEIQTDVTATAYNYYSQPKIVASHPGLTRLDHFTAVQGTLNNTTVTNQYGFAVGNTLQDAVNNTAFYGNLQLNTKIVNTMSQTGTTVTAVTTIAHTLKVGSVVSIMGCSDASFDISRAIVTAISTTTVLNDTFTFTVTTTRTVGSTTVTGTLTDLSDLNLEMLGTAPNLINGYLLAGRSNPYFDSMQVGDPGGTQIFPNNQFVGGIAAITNSTNLTFGASITLFKNYSATPTDMTAAPTGMNIGHIYWGTTDGRKYINAASINVRTTDVTNPANSGGGGARTDMIFNVANNAMPAEIARFTGATGLLQMAAGKSITIEGVQLNTGTKANTAWLASGTANSTTFLRGDGTWATATGTSVTPSIARTFALMGA